MPKGVKSENVDGEDELIIFLNCSLTYNGQASPARARSRLVRVMCFLTAHSSTQSAAASGASVVSCGFTAVYALAGRSDKTSAKMLFLSYKKFCRRLPQSFFKICNYLRTAFHVLFLKNQISTELIPL